MSASYQVKVVLEKLRGAIRVESEPTIGPRAAEKERPGAPVSPSPGTCRREALGAQPPDRMDDPRVTPPSCRVLTSDCVFYPPISHMFRFLRSNRKAGLGNATESFQAIFPRKAVFTSF